MINHKPIIPNGYNITDNETIKLRVIRNNYIEVYQLKNNNYLYLLFGILNIPESKFSKFNIKEVNIGNRHYYYFVSKK